MGTSYGSESSIAHARLLRRAQRGDQAAFRSLTDPHRRELQFHCYRMLGTIEDAEDALQETLLGAWRGLQSFEARSSLRAWLYRIATNRCLDALRNAARRPPAPAALPFEAPDPTRLIERTWVEPYPDVLLEGLVDAIPGPEALYETRETIELAFIALLQELPPRQRAALVLRDALGFRTAEVANMLDVTEDSVKAALKRARATAKRGSSGDRQEPPPPDSASERELARRFAEVFESGDVGAIVALLTDDARVRMPPFPFEYQGLPAVGAFLSRLFAWAHGQRDRLVPMRANGQPAFACYRYDANGLVGKATGLLVLTLEGERVGAITRFLDESMVPRFGLPQTLRK